MPAVRTQTRREAAVCGNRQVRGRGFEEIAENAAFDCLFIGAEFRYEGRKDKNLKSKSNPQGRLTSMLPTKSNPSSGLDRPTPPEDDVVSNRSSFESAKTHQSVSSRGTRADDEAESSGDDRPKNPAPAASSSVAPDDGLRKVSSRRTFQPFAPTVRSSDDSSDTETEMGRAPGPGIPLRSRPKMSEAEAAARAANTAYPGVPGSSRPRTGATGRDAATAGPLDASLAGPSTVEEDVLSDEDIDSLVHARPFGQSTGGPATQQQRDLQRHQTALAGAHAAYVTARDSGSEAEGTQLRELRPTRLRETMRTPEERTKLMRLAVAVKDSTLQVAKSLLLNGASVAIPKDVLLQGAALAIPIGFAEYGGKGFEALIGQASDVLKVCVAGGIAATAIAGELYALIMPRITADTALRPSPRSDASNAVLMLAVAASGVANYYNGTLAEAAVPAARVTIVQVLRALTLTSLNKSTNRSEHDSRTLGRTAAASVAIAVLVDVAFQFTNEYGAYGGASKAAQDASWTEASIPFLKNTAIYSLLVEGGIAAFIDALDVAKSRHAPGEELTTAARDARNTGADPRPSAADNLSRMKVSVDRQLPRLQPLNENFVNDSAPNAALANTLVQSASLIGLAGPMITSNPSAQRQIGAALNALLVAALLPFVISAGERNPPYAEGSLLSKTVDKSARVQAKEQAKADRQREIDAGGEPA